MNQAGPDPKNFPHRATLMRFAGVFSSAGKRLHVGCIMAVGEGWVEVSLPELFALGSGLSVTIYPYPHLYPVRESWRMRDRVGLCYTGEQPDLVDLAGVNFIRISAQLRASTARSAAHDNDGEDTSAVPWVAASG